MKPRFDAWFIVIAFVALLAGEIFGEWMGATENLQFHPLHAHVNLAGWATLALYGILHRLYPALGTSRLALPQFLLAVLSLPVFIYGIYVTLTDPKHPGIAIGGSMAFLLGTLLFFVMFVRKVAMAKNET